MPIKMPKCAGELYRPSNGTEGMMFIERWCDNCIKDNQEEEIFCPVLGKSFMGNVPEWIFDDEGIPKCTAYTETEPFKEDTSSGNLFEEK